MLRMTLTSVYWDFLDLGGRPLAVRLTINPIIGRIGWVEGCSGKSRCLFLARSRARKLGHP
jgi:hypothetical protein